MVCFLIKFKISLIVYIPSGKIGARLSVDALNVRRLVGDTLALIVQSLATLICGFVVAMVANWQLALIITVVIPLVGIQGYAQVKFLQGFSADAKVRPITFQIFFSFRSDNNETGPYMEGYASYLFCVINVITLELGSNIW
jgi:ABC-type multidrug transport system fused ATPase/permease subunit